MMHYFLVFVTLVAGVPSGKPILAFTSSAACAVEGEKVAASHRSDPTPIQGYWECLGVDFDRADPMLRGPVPEEPKRLPARPPDGQIDA